MKRAALMLFVAGLAGGCATSPPPKQPYIEASSAIRAAEEMAKSDKPIPDAELYLARARDHLRTGEKMLESRNYTSARMHFERAEAEAEASLSLARARIAEDEAKTAEAQLNDPEVQANVDAD